MRSLSDYSKIRALILRFRRGSRSQVSRRSLPLDIGCSPNGSEDFVNLDYDWKPGVDVVWDITVDLPFEEGRFEGIYTEHCLEHIPLAATNALLASCHRILKPGGTVRVIVPDGEIFIDSYRELRNNGTRPYSRMQKNMSSMESTIRS